MTDIRLTSLDGAGSNGGRLEVYHNGQWGTVCSHGWTDTESSVVCKELGYSTGTQFKGDTYTGCNISVLAADVHCNGEETTFQECIHGWDAHGEMHNCSAFEAVGIICTGTIEGHVLCIMIFFTFKA